MRRRRVSSFVKQLLTLAAIAMPASSAVGAKAELPKPAACASDPAIIKGNVGRKKARLYYLPTHKSYRRVKINKRGERWFCTEEEARRAGWTKAPASKRKPLPRAVHDAADWVIPSEVATPGCDIKGNVSRDAKRFHVRGSPYYAETKVEVARGDRWFCTEQLAIAAGFEKAGTYIGGPAKQTPADCVVPDDPRRPPGCTIKGNVSRSGKIYHVLGSKFYAETTITLARGERWFCTREEAERANWRPPKNAGEPLTCPLANIDRPTGASFASTFAGNE